MTRLQLGDVLGMCFFFSRTRMILKKEFRGWGYDQNQKGCGVFLVDFLLVEYLYNSYKKGEYLNYCNVYDLEMTGAMKPILNHSYLFWGSGFPPLRMALAVRKAAMELTAAGAQRA